MSSKFVLILWMLSGHATNIERRDPIDLQTQMFADQLACQRALDAMRQQNRPDIRFSFDGICVAESTALPRMAKAKKAR